MVSRRKRCGGLRVSLGLFLEGRVPELNGVAASEGVEDIE